MSKNNTNKVTSTVATRESIMAEYKTWRAKFNACWEAEQKAHSKKLATWKKELASYLADRDAKLEAAKAEAAKAAADAKAKKEAAKAEVTEAKAA